MKFFLTFIFSFIFLGGLLLSCKSKALPEVTEITRTVETVKRDTIVKIEKDSSYYEAYIDCVNGKPVLVENEKQVKDYNSRNSGQTASLPKTQNGRDLKSPSVNLENGKLNVNCQKEAQKLFLSWREQYVKELQKSIVPAEPKIIEKPLTKFQKFKMQLGNGVIWLIGLVAVAFLIRFLIRKFILK